MSYSNGDVSVAPCSAKLAALCALGNETDVHFLRLLGRSCARRAELALACGRGTVPERVYVKHDDVALEPIDDEVPAACRGGDQDAPVAGLLGMFNLFNEARERVAFSYDSLLLYARRLLQEDRYAALYLLLHAFMEDDADLVHAVVDGARLAHAELDTPPAPQIDGVDDDDADDDDEETSEQRAARERYEAALLEGAEAAATKVASRAVFAFWGTLTEREPRELRTYYEYVSTTRSDMSGVPHMTLADRLVYLGAALRAWRALPALLQAVAVREATCVAMLDAARVKCGAETVTTGVRLEQAGLLTHRASGQRLHRGRVRIIGAIGAAREPEQHTLAELASNARLVDLCCRVLLDGASDDANELAELHIDEADAVDDLPPATGAPRVTKADSLPREELDLVEARFAAACHFARGNNAAELAAALADATLAGNVWRADGLLLRVAAACDAPDCLALLLARDDVPPEARDVALGRAAEENVSLAVVEQLLAAGASAGAFDSYALRRAAAFGNGPTTRALLDAGAARRARTDEALFAASRAADAGALAALLADTKAYEGVSDAEWHSLHAAASHACAELLASRVTSAARLAAAERAIDARGVVGERRDELLARCTALLESGESDSAIARIIGEDKE